MPAASASLTVPSGLPSSTTTTRPCARFGSRDTASPTVVCGVTRTGVSKIGCEPLTLPTTSATTSVGMSCGMIATPPRRATVSAIRRPETAVMLATTNGRVVPTWSVLRRSTSSREVTADRRGTMKTSEYVRSYAGGGLRKRTCFIVPQIGGGCLTAMLRQNDRDRPLKGATRRVRAASRLL